MSKCFESHNFERQVNYNIQNYIFFKSKSIRKVSQSNWLSAIIYFTLCNYHQVTLIAKDLLKSRSLSKRDKRKC